VTVAMASMLEPQVHLRAARFTWVTALPNSIPSEPKATFASQYAIQALTLKPVAILDCPLSINNTGAIMIA
jgi:hypothetical protein